jgi:hypothetical protein
MAVGGKLPNQILPAHRLTDSQATTMATKGSGEAATAEKTATI